MAKDALSAADLRLTARAIRGYRGSIQLTATKMGSTVRADRIAALTRLEKLYGQLADEKERRARPR
jgi:hypothetical protein